MSYQQFFSQVTGRNPLPYQERVGNLRSRLTVLSIPTGLGKTDAVLTAWLHRVASEPKDTPRRLLWCLPGRALTEQVVEVARSQIERAGLGDTVSVLRLMGASKDNDLSLRPDQFAIFVGTQDILLSRALNRGYARSPYRWPMDFGLLNNDALWVLDEVQLLGDGLATSTQLSGFREQCGAFGRNESVWISATLHRSWLRTIDFGDAEAMVREIVLEQEDQAHETVRRRTRATKSIEQAPAACRTPRGLARFVSEKHRPGTLTLVVVNTVNRARETWQELLTTNSDAALIHSRFRPQDREDALSALRRNGIIVSTQVIEAGIDISARVLITDAAPYASLVQRFGRVNRYGEDIGQIYWVDRPLTGKTSRWAVDDELDEKQRNTIFAPYDLEEVEGAIQILRGLKSAAPADLPRVEGLPPWRHVLRHADLLDLFDTTPDLAGNEIDISRFVRLSNDTDAYIAWRQWEGGEKDNPPTQDKVDVQECELCPVPIGECRDFARNQQAWVWDALEGKWEKIERWYPGLIALFHVMAGGYTREGGWNPASKVAVAPADAPESISEAYPDDRLSIVSYRQSLRDHTEQVCEEMERLITALESNGCGEFRESLLAAARLHDWGKAHPVMQYTLHNGPGPYKELLAKQRRKDAAQRHARKYFRHELASALAMLAIGRNDLEVYLVAAHHGRVRLSIRSMPDERNGRARITRGIKEGDELLPCDLGGGCMEALPLTLQCMELGGDGNRSWSDRMTALRDRLGPFRLAYLELLLRSADELASEKAARMIPCT